MAKQIFKNTQILNANIVKDPFVQKCVEYALDNDVEYEDQQRYVLFYPDKDYRLFVTHMGPEYQFYYLGMGNYKSIRRGRFKNPEALFKWAKQHILE
jgi:hypothetical protein